MLTLLLASSAWSGDYTAADVLVAWQAGMSDPVVHTIAGLVGAVTAAEKACLLAAGMPNALVERLAGPVPSPLELEQVKEVCVPLGLGVAVAGGAREASDAEALAARVEARRAVRGEAAALEQRVDCYVYGVFPKQEPVVEWMRHQVGAGATGFVSLADSILCSW